MAEETQYTANTGLSYISIGNSNLDGTGTLVTALTAASNGTLLKSVFILATGSVTQGMLRFFIQNGANIRLLKEIEVPATVASAIDLAFQTRVDMDFALKSGDKLVVSTQNSETFHIVAEGLDWSYYSTSVRTDTTQYTAVTGLATLTTASDQVTVLTAGSKGCSIESITIKAQGNPADGVIQLFVYDEDELTIGFKEIKVTAVTKSAIAHSYEYNLVFENDFELKAGYSLIASTKQTQTFSVIAEGLNWAYPA